MFVIQHNAHLAWKCTDDGLPTNKTQKPFELLERILTHHTGYGGTVLDLCAGSHSLMFACLEIGRSCISVEEDDRQYQSAIQRMIQVQQAKHDARVLERARQEEEPEHVILAIDALARKAEEENPSERLAILGAAQDDPDATQEDGGERLSGTFRDGSKEKPVSN